MIRGSTIRGSYGWGPRAVVGTIKKLTRLGRRAGLRQPRNTTETAWEAHPDHLRGLPGIDCHGILTQDSPELSVTGCQLCKGFYINIGDHSCVSSRC